MKRRLLTTAGLMLWTLVFAVCTMAQSVTVLNNTAGGLWDALDAQGVTDFTTVKSLTVTGEMNITDFLLVKNQLTNLETLDISGTNVTEIPREAFSQRENLTTVRLPEGMIYLQENAFNSCRKLEVVTFGNQTATAGKIVFPAKLRRIESNAFSNCTLLTHLDFTACTSLEYLGGYAFCNINNLKEVLLPSKGNLNIGYECFNVYDTWDQATQQYLCKGLESIIITKAVKYLEGGCLPRSLKTLYVESATPPSASSSFIYDSNSLTTIYIPKGSKRNYAIADGWSSFYGKMQETGFQVKVTGFGTLQMGGQTYSNGDVFFNTSGSAATVKAVPIKGNEIISVKLDDVALNVAADGTFTIPAGTTTGTLDVAFTSNPITIDNANGGELKNNLIAAGLDPNTLVALKVTGTMTTKDWNYVKNSLTVLESFDISETDVKIVPEQALQQHQRLTTIHLSSTVTTIGSSALNNCPQLTTVDGCENVAEIGSSAFSYSPKLANFPFGDKIKSIESNAFEDCTSLPKKLVLPESVYNIGWSGTFRGSSIREFDLRQCHLTQNISQGIFGAATSVLLPEYGNYGVDMRTFENSNITELRIPASVNYIGEYAVTSLMERIYAQSATPIRANSYAFSNVDPNFCVLYVPVGSKDAYAEANGWSIFTKIQEQGIKVDISGFGSLLQGNISYANGAVIFASEGSATTLKAVPETDNELISVKLDGVALNVAADGTFTIPAGTEVGTLDVAFTTNMLTVNNPNGGELKDMISALGMNPRTIRTLKVTGKMSNKDWNYVKSTLTALEAFDISETDVKIIPEQAFQEHQRLTTIHLPLTVVSIGYQAFSYCPQLTTVEGCENVQEIGNEAFWYCSKLSHFPFGNKIKSLRNAFASCTSLPEELVLTATLTNLESYVFQSSSVRRIDLSQCTFTGNISYSPFGPATSVLLPENGNYSLGWEAFKDTPLTELRLPAAVTSIYGERILPTTLERLYVSRSIPINLDGSSSFNNLDFENCTLYVPVGSVDAYSEAVGWSNFTNVKEYGMQVTVGEQGKVRADGQTLMGTTTFFPKESTTTFEILPNAGWHADAVTLDGVDIPFADNKFILSGAQLTGKLAVAFAINQFDLQLQITGSGKVKRGSIEYSAASQTLKVDSLATLSLTLEPAAGQVVSGITFNGQESVVQNGGTSYVTPAIIANSTLAITFGAGGAEGDVVTYTVKTGEGGSVEYKNATLLPETTIQVSKGQDAVFAMKPDQYFVVDVVKLNGQDVTDLLDADGKLTVSDVQADATLEVTFRINSELTLVMEEGASLSNMLTETQKQNVTKLTIKGRINDQDFFTMRDEMPLLSVIDLWETQVEYIPYKAFCTSDNYENPLGKTTLTSVRLPQTTRTIGGNAFAGCSNLKEVNFTELTNLENLDYYSFQATNLQVIDLSNTKLTEIREAFRNVKNLEDIKFPATLTYLGTVFSGSSLTEIDLSNCSNLKTLESTFSECKKLVKVTLPEGIVNINYAFSGCENLTTINFPKSLQSIGASAFSNTKLQKVDLSGLTELKNIGNSAFSSCQELTEVLLPTSLTQLGSNAFSYCQKLTSVDLSKTKLTNIQEWTFYSCNSLDNAKLPKTLETIDTYAFSGCYKLTGVLELGPKFTSIGKYALNSTQLSVVKSEATVPPVLSNEALPTTCIAAFVPEGCADAYKSAPIWEDMTILDKEVHAEVTVTSEGNLAVDITEQAKIAPATITHLKVHGPLGVQDFAIIRSNMTMLLDLDMSDAQVSVIPENALLDKKVLMSIKLPESLLRIEQGAFRGCSSLAGTLTLSTGLNFIGYGAFQGCNSLEKVELNDNLAVIQGFAFEGCSSLAQELTLPKDFQSLGESAFANCTSLYGTVKFNNGFYMFMGTEGYGSSAGSCFSNCSKIETVDMSLTDLDEIPYATFRGCTSLNTVLLPPLLDRIDDSAFADCSSLNGIEFPDLLRVINQGAFQNCTSLTSVDLSECTDLGSIEPYAFYGCSSLETVDLPKSVNWIRDYAFAGCRRLSNITVEATTPADLGEYVFRKVHTDRCVLAIPTGTFNDYLSAAQWGAFVNMRKNIDVTVGEGANLYFVNEDGEAAASRRAAGTAIMGAKVKDGSSLYVQENETATFRINPDENIKIAKVLYNGKDVTSELVDGVYKTPGVTDASSFEVQVNVVGDIHVKELRMLDSEVALKMGETRKLKYAVYPTNATNKTIDWTSGNESVAKVDSEGNITPVSAGRTEITAKTVDGDFEQKCEITVISNNYWIVMEDNVENYIENTVSFPIALHNESEARAIQFDVYMPEGIDIDPWYGNFQLSERANGYQVSAARKSDGSVRVIVYSQQSGNSFQNSDGEILTLPFNTGEKTGKFDVTIKDIHISGPNNIDFVAPEKVLRFNLKDYPLGDSDGNGSVTITDAVQTVDYILENYPGRFMKKAADVNKDDLITVADVTGTVDIVLERPANNRAAAHRSAPDAQGRLYMDELKMVAGEQNAIGMQIENATDFIAFQCDVYLPEGMTVTRDDNEKLLVNLAGSVSSSHVVSANILDNGALRIVVVSSQNEIFRLTNNNIVNLMVTPETSMMDGSMIEIRDIRMVRASDNSEYLAPDVITAVHFGDATGIDAINGIDGSQEGQAFDVFDLRGNKVRSDVTNLSGLSKGVYIVNGKKVMVK